ncbi:MAG TPA: hypothetical protein VFQ20_12405 [Burkholderiaceae bacterium]|nr:hypothetical protein [Burkholderiaceae bacterium]
MGWTLVAGALLAGWFGYGWKGLVLALSVIVFWLLLQFSRSLRVLRLAAGAPVGHVASAVMLNARLAKGLRLADVIKLTGSLGRKLRDEPDEAFVWTDAGGVSVEVEFRGGRCTQWTLARPNLESDPSPSPQEPTT